MLNKNIFFKNIAEYKDLLEKRKSLYGKVYMTIESEPE